MSAQLQMEFSRPVTVPDGTTQCGRILRALQRGEQLTVVEALSRYGCFALSQRIGELKRMGWPITSRRYKTQGGAVVARYALEKNI